MSRLPLITDKSQLSPEHQPIADAILGSRGTLKGPFSVFLHAPEAAGRVAHLGTLVRFEGSLDFRARTLAALVVAREFDAQYVWGAQTGAGRKRDIPETTIAAIRENRSDGIPSEDLQIVEFTRALLRRHRVTDEQATAMRARFGDDGFIQMTTAIGYYSLLSMTVNACEVPPAPGADVLVP